MAARIPFVWSNDDITVGRTAELRRQLEFIDRLGIPGVFFVIPHDRHDRTGIDQDVELMRVIEKSRGRGHEYYQHGFIHTPFESGVPETWMLDMVPEVRAEYDIRRLEIEKQHTLPAMTQMIENGAAIWRRAFGENSVGYRPGWGAFCGALYQALGDVGVTWCSARIPCPTSWKWNNGLWNEPLDFRAGVPVQPMRVGKVIEFPLAGDYAFRVPAEEEKIDAMARLGMREMAYLHEQQAPMIVCSHYHGLENNGGTGYRVHERLLPKLLESGKVEPMNMSGLMQWSQARGLPA